MYKLLKYEFLNTYKYMITFITFILLGFGIEFYMSLVKNENIDIASFISVAVFGVFIIFNIFNLNDNIKNKEGMILFSVPEERSKIFVSKVLVVIIYTFLLVSIDSIFRGLFKSVPFIGNVGLSKVSASLSVTEKFYIHIFYFLWSATFIIQLIISGIFVVVISNAIFKNNIYNFLISVITLIMVFFLNITFMKVFIYKLSWEYTIQFDIDRVEGVIREMSNQSLLPYKDVSVFNQHYNEIIMNFGAPLFCFIWIMLVGKITKVIFSKRLEI